MAIVTQSKIDAHVTLVKKLVPSGVCWIDHESPPSVVPIIIGV
jgi:hypothetical protein